MFAGRDKNVRIQFALIGMEITRLAIVMIGAHDLAIAALKDGKHFAFVAVSAANVACEHGISVQGIFHGAVGDEQIAVAVIGDKEPEPAFISRNGTLDCAELLGSAEAVAGIGEKLALADECMKNISKCNLLPPSEMKLSCDLLVCIQGKRAVLYVFQNRLFCVQRILRSCEKRASISLARLKYFLMLDCPDTVKLENEENDCKHGENAKADHRPHLQF